MTAAASRFLEPHALAAVGHMRFTTRHRLEGAYSGRHRSRRRGGSGEFVDYREYTGGEDLRRLDWKVLGRTGRTYLRLYQDETDLQCLMLLDASGSMTYGGMDGGLSKLAYVQYLSTAMSYVIGQQRDNVGLAVVGRKLEQYLDPASVPRHITLVQQAIAGIEPVPATRMADAMQELFTLVKRRGVLFIMSDLLVDDLEALFAAVRLFRHRHWEVVVLHVVHPQEERLPRGLAVRFVGLEGESAVSCQPHLLEQAYEQRFEAHAAAVRSLALAAGCDYRRVSTAVPYVQTLGGFLVERSG